MKRLIISAFIILTACNGSEGEQTPPADPDLASAPLGGEYLGAAHLDRDSCNGYDKENEADKEYFEPFYIEVKFYPQNEEHSKLTFEIGQIILKDVVAVAKFEGGRVYYEINHETWEEYYFSLLAMNLYGTVEAGKMNLELLQGLYDGTKDDHGEKSCEVLYKLHAQKVLNYPYVKP